MLALAAAALLPALERVRVLMLELVLVLVVVVAELPRTTNHTFVG